MGAVEGGAMTTYMGMYIFDPLTDVTSWYIGIRHYESKRIVCIWELWRLCLY